MMTQILHIAIEKSVLAYDTDNDPLIEFSLEATKDFVHGDFYTNAAMLLAKKKQLPPSEVARELVNKLSVDELIKGVFTKIEVAGPGFINFYLSTNYLTEELQKVSDLSKDYGRSTVGLDKKALVEYSSPNIGKNFSIGNFRSTIIGAAIANLYAAIGYSVVGENHLGDWGTQFGMILAAIKENSVDLEKLNLEQIEELYVEFNSKSKEDTKMRVIAKEWFKKLEQGESEAHDLWKKVVEISMSEYEHVYNALGIKIENNHGESFYEDKMEAIIKEAKEKGISTQSQGATIVEFENLPPAMLVKSDGTSTYFTRDLAAIRYRLDAFNPDLFIYEVGAEQSLHFKQVFKAAQMLGWTSGKEFVHLAHGLVLVDGKKMSTRAGTTVKVNEVLDQAIDKAKQLSKTDDDSLAKQVGIGAVKYFDLSHHPSSNINFDWKLVLSLEGNSGPYLQYAYARTQSVLSKATTKPSLDHVELGSDEINLIRQIVRFQGTIVNAAKSYSPNILTEYLFGLAQQFNSYYNANKIIGSSNEVGRLLVTQAVGIVLGNGLNLLGIETPKRM